MAEPNPVVDALTDKTPPPSDKTPKTDKGPDLEAKVTQIVDGKAVEKSLKEWLVDASKASGAESRLQRAAEAIKVVDALDTVNDPTADEAKVVAAQTFLYKRAGLADDTINQLLSKNPPSPETGRADGKKTEMVSDPRVAGLEAKLEHWEGVVGAKMDLELDGAVEAAVTQDPALAVYLGSPDRPAPAGRKGMLTEVLRQKAVDLMNQRKSAGEKFSPGWIAEAVKAATPAAVKHAGLVIGAPSTLGRAAETMLGADAEHVLSQETKIPGRGAPRKDFEAYIKTELFKTAVASPRGPSRA